MTNPYEELVVVSVKASGDDGAGNVAAKVLDKDIGGSSRWSNMQGWIEADLGALYKVHNVDLAWYKGTERKTRFKILVSDDGVTYRYVTWRSSSGKTLDPEKYDIPDEVCRYIRLEFMGSANNDGTANEWFSITHLIIEGINTPIIPPAPQPVLASLNYNVEGGQEDTSGNINGTTEDEFKLNVEATSDQGSPMPDQTVNLLINEVVEAIKTTDTQGKAVFIHKFSEVGTYQVAVENPA